PPRRGRGAHRRRRAGARRGGHPPAPRRDTGRRCGPGGRSRPAGRRRAALAGLYQLRPVPELRRARGALPRPGAGAASRGARDVTEVRRYPPDLLLLVSVLGLLVVGIVMVYSASFIVAHNDFGDENYFLTRHLVFLTVGLILMGFLAGVDYHRWRRWAWPAMGLSVVLLLLVLVPGIGVEAYGARRWLPPGIQPSELAKIALVLFLAAWLSGQHRPAGGLTSGSLPFVLIVGLVAALIMKEPDMGTTIVVVLASATVFWVAGANVLHVGSVAVIGGLGLAWLATA